MDTPEQILKQYWGYDGFRPLQREIIASILDNKDTLALLPTGGGKSLCYQVPAMMTDGVCIVVSPLIALMQDQVTRLKTLDVPAECIHSGQHFNDVKRILDNTIHGGYKLLYVSPERLQTELFREYLDEMELSMVAVDEAHCISQWGHDFRPDYLQIAGIKHYFPDVPILALTASATMRVQDDIIEQLQLNQPAVFKQSFARNNIFYEVDYSENKNGETTKKLNKQCSIIYCRSRKQTESVSRDLQQIDVEAATYHAGMNKDSRDDAQEAWMNDHKTVIVATTAFGMGIDKPGVRMVLHYDAPENLEAYYQEAGRAGRDGKASNALLLYNSNDIKRLLESIDLHYPPEAYLRQVYQSVAEYLQIPIGCEPDKYYPFDVYDFSKKFSLQMNNAIHALKLLEREGLWTLSEAVFKPSTIQFITDREVLDTIGQVHPGLEYITVGLLRMYSGIFHFPTPVRETAIARQLRIKKDDLINALEQLHHLRILEYIKPSEGPQLYFHHNRADSKYLIIDMKRINLLRQRHIERTHAMIAFIENKIACRERMLLEYFGESTQMDCGHCDVCRSMQEERPDPDRLKKELLLIVTECEPIAVQELADKYSGAHKHVLLQVARRMIDDKIFFLDQGMIRLSK